MIEKLREFENKKPEIIFSWQDPYTEAQGWVVINSLRNGSAGGGTRMRKGLDLNEVISLAKTMEIKFQISGPDIGGAKSGINFDPTDPRKEEVLKRWFRAVIPMLKHYYGTGGDLNVDELKEVIPFTSELRLLHPQEGIVSGHIKFHGEQKRKIIKQLQEGVPKIVKKESLLPDNNHEYRVADLITGYGVAMSVIHFHNIWKEDLKNKKVIVQGFGNVGGPTCFYLAQAGMKIVGITDKDGGVISEEGFTFEEIKDLLSTRKNNIINSEEKIFYPELNDKIWKLHVDVFIPAAGSKFVNKSMIETMINHGLSLISCGANVPFEDEDVFLGKTGLFADNNISVIPDFIANCGMARVFAYLMQENANLDIDAIFKDTSDTIKKALENIYTKNKEKTSISQTALDLVLDSIL
ncbi:MAG: Glu/Leu/Phe/Val dehydrogenase dimerization domain-containing protein [Candidatus Sericytochromatia bacterium]